MSLENKVIIVTGSSGFLGKSICKKFIELNNIVIGLDVTKPNSFKYKNFHFFKTNLNKDNSIKSTVNKIKKNFRNIDVIINNARPNLLSKDFDKSMEEWDLAISVLLKAPARIIFEALENLKKSKGVIVNISSTNGQNVSHQPLGYHVAKAGIDHMTKVLAYRLGSSGIRVNSISPGVIQNNQNTNSFLEAKTIPLSRAGEIHEIIDLVVFLSSSKSSYINGQNIIIDGGMSLGCPYFTAFKTLNNF